MFTIICPWILKVFPNMANHRTNKVGYADVVKMVKELIVSHKETHDKNQPRDFIDCYLTEILKTDDPQSSFYTETGEDNLTTLLIDLFVVRAANIHLLYLGLWFHSQGGYNTKCIELCFFIHGEEQRCS